MSERRVFKRKDLQDLASIRLKERKLLLAAGGAEGAYYLAGYAAECALKACIARQTERFEFPAKERVIDSWTHDLAKLLKLAGLQDEMMEAHKRSPKLNANWSLVSQWKEVCRYERPSLAQAEALIDALDDPKQGVFRWLKRRW